jgi:catechol 2,3-dioxygenase-like lactoylglutathione lyase family enzyme
MIRRFSHVGLCVRDLERSLRFYRDGFGFREVSKVAIGGEPTATLLELPDVRLEARFLERDGLRLELLHYVTPAAAAAAGDLPMNRPGLTHLSFRVDDLDAALARLAAVGAAVREQTRVGVAAMGAQVVFVTDPDGTRIELVQAPGDPEKLPGER